VVDVCVDFEKEIEEWIEEKTQKEAKYNKFAFKK